MSGFACHRSNQESAETRNGIDYTPNIGRFSGPGAAKDRRIILSADQSAARPVRPVERKNGRTSTKTLTRPAGRTTVVVNQPGTSSVTGVCRGVSIGS